MALYLHYWFANYAQKNGVTLGQENGKATDLYSSFNASKNKAAYFGKNGILNKEFSQRKSNFILGSSSAKEMEELIDFLSNPDTELAKIRGEVYQGGLVENWSPTSLTKTFSDPNRLASDISIFLQELQQRIADMADRLNLDLDALKSQIIQEYAETKGLRVGSKNFSKSVIQDFITHNGIKKLNLKTSPGTESATLNSCVRSIILLASALPDYGESGRMSLGSMKYSTSTDSGISGSGNATLGIIAGKLSGLWNNVVGRGGEIAWKKAEEVGLKELSEETKLIEKEIPTNYRGKNLSYSVRVSGEDVVSNLQDKTLKSVSKPDVIISITDNNVTIEYGVSVKQYKFNSKSNSKSISIVHGTSFLEALKRYMPSGKDFGYVMNLAGGHPGQGGSKKKAGDYTTALLNTAWNNLVESVVIRNMLDFLVGVVNTGATTLYIVVNGRIFKIEEILDNLLTSDNGFSARVYQETIRKNGTKGSKGLTRASLMKMNKWIWSSGNKQKGAQRVNDRRTDLGKERSEQAYSAIYERLAEQKLQVSLNSIIAGL